MGFGYNRYLMVLAAFALVAAPGCSDKKKNRSNQASTVAPSTTSSTASTTSSGIASTTSGNGPQLTAARFNDVDGNKMVSQGDTITLSFDGQLAQAAGKADPASEFALAVGGDSFGVGATLQSGTQARELDVVLGSQPRLRISDPFDIASTLPGSSSGINVGLSPTGDVRGIDGGTVRAAQTPVDIDGALQAGFLTTASLNFARGGHNAVVLNDGRVLIVGGASAKGSKGYVAQPEIFDPITNTFTPTAGTMKRGKVAVKFVNGTATKLSDGTVLICGGIGVEKKKWFGFGGEKVDTLETAFIFDPSSDSFKRVKDMEYPRHSHTATLLDDGRVLIAGGYNDSFWKKHKTQAPFEFYNPAKKKFEKAGWFFKRFKSDESRMNHTATSIEGGSGVLLTGGNYYKGGGLFGLFKPKLKMTSGSEVVRGKKTHKAGKLNTPRMDHAAAATNPRNVLVAGGHDPSAVHSSLELFDSATGTWTAVGDLARARTNCQIGIDGNRAMVIGGSDGKGEVDTVEVFNSDSKSLSQTTYTMATGRNACTVSQLKDGRILVVGGMTGAGSLDGLDGQPLASAEIFVRQ